MIFNLFLNFKFGYVIFSSDVMKWSCLVPLTVVVMMIKGFTF